MKQTYTNNQLAIFLFMTLMITMGGAKVGWGQTALINENIQNWTTQVSYGTYEQEISAGTVTMVQCIVQPGASASETGSTGRVQMQAIDGILALPLIPSVSTAEFNIIAGGGGRTVKLQKFNGTTWDDITTFSGIDNTGATYTHSINQNSPVSLRLSGPSHALYVHDIIIYEYGDSEKTATPSFTPPAGIYTTTQNIEIASATDGAIIFYSLISETDSWTEYTAPISVSETTTIWAYATTDGMDDSDVSSATYTFPVIKKWSGGAATSNWSESDNWSPVGVPGVAENVMLDNTFLSGSFTVELPGGTVQTEIATLTISPLPGNTITLGLPNSNTANPGLKISGTGDALTIHEGGVFRNSTTASAGSGFELTGAGSQIRINNGGRYIHNTTRAHAAAILAKLSKASGTEQGVFEFDVPGTAFYSPSTSNRTYGTLVLSAQSSGSRTYSFSGVSPLTIRGNLITGDNVSLTSEMSGNIIIDGDFELSSTGGAIFNSQSTLTVHGTLTNSAGTSGLVLEPGASLLHNSTGVNATVKQSIAGGGTWTKANEKSGTAWYWISPPVSGQSISAGVGSFTNHDLYRWDEPNDTWRNYKGSSFVHADFESGAGYLFGSQDVANFNYQGTLYADNMVWSSLSKQGAGSPPDYGPGWHLLGNPYTVGLRYLESGAGEWTGTHVARTPQYWTGSGYDACKPGEVIPIGTAFFVQVETHGGSLTVPAAAREGVAPATKSGEYHRIIMTARPVDGNTWQRSHVRLEPEVATEGFDTRFHSRFRAGHAPQLYSVMGDNRLLVHAVRKIHNDLTIPFAFIKNDESHNFRIELSETIPNTTLFLADLKTGTVHELGFDSHYAFTAEEDDDPMRFELRFQAPGDPTSTKPPVNEHQARIYTSGNTLYINFNEATASNRLEVYDLSGRLLIQQQLSQATHHQHTLNLQTGVYVVRLTGPQHIQTERVFVP